jgi:hypothetical protein
MILLRRAMTKHVRCAGSVVCLGILGLTLAACETSQTASGRAATSASTAATTPPFTTPTTSPRPPTTLPTTAPDVATSIRCQASDLRLAIGQLVSEKTEQHSVLLTVTNVGSGACYLVGYPGISLYDQRGVALSLSYDWRGDQMITSSAPPRVGLTIGAKGYVLINKNVCVGPPVASATTLQFIPPDDTGVLVLDNPPGGFASCEPGDIGGTVDISPVEPTEADVFSQPTIP